MNFWVIGTILGIIVMVVAGIIVMMVYRSDDPSRRP